jgi:2-iminobutanoate/2-iminopropanoate deaminase
MNFTSTEKAPSAIGPYSQAVTVNNIVYTSGQIALLPNGSDELIINGTVEKQAKQVLENLTAVLKASNSDLNSVIKTTIFLADMNDFAKINEIYSDYFGSHKPARSTVAVKTLPKNALIEIDAVAMTLK